MLRVCIQVSGMLKIYADDKRTSPNQKKQQVTSTRPFSKLAYSIWVFFITAYKLRLMYSFSRTQYAKKKIQGRLPN